VGLAIVGVIALNTGNGRRGFQPRLTARSSEPAAGVNGLRRFTHGGTHRLAFPSHQRRRSRRRPDSEDAMRKHLFVDEEPVRDDHDAAEDDAAATVSLPNRLLTAFEVAEYIGCHEETVRRAYSRGLLTSQRFGVRGRRFHPADVLDWIKRGAPTRLL
jgi:excisionase family DNA binding protein